MGKTAPQPCGNLGVALRNIRESRLNPETNRKMSREMASEQTGYEPGKQKRWNMLTPSDIERIENGTIPPYDVSSTTLKRLFEIYQCTPVEQDTVRDIWVCHRRKYLERLAAPILREIDELSSPHADNDRTDEEQAEGTDTPDDNEGDEMERLK